MQGLPPVAAAVVAELTLPEAAAAVSQVAAAAELAAAEPAPALELLLTVVQG